MTLTAALLISLAVPQGCSTAEDGGAASESAPVSETAPEHDGGAVSEPVPESGVEAVQPPDLDAITPETDEQLHERILILYGGTYEQTDDGRMTTLSASLYYADEWTSPEELSPGAYFTWFMTTTWSEKISDEEREALYTLPDREGWVFPQEIYEARIQSHFDVSAEHLRSDESLYHPELEAYWLGSGGGVGARPFVELRGVELDGDRLVFTVELVYEEVYADNENWRLTVLPEEDGGWKYESWVRLD